MRTSPLRNARSPISDTRHDANPRSGAHCDTVDCRDRRKFRAALGVADDDSDADAGARRTLGAECTTTNRCRAAQ
jgi:hypothetical protein